MPPLPQERKGAAVGALAAYHTSIAEFKAEIVSNSVQQDANLWTTLLLGLFELMYDASGEGWVKHFLYGTSKMLQLRGPEAHVTGSGRTLFLTVRVFEICRALIYPEPSFLCQPEWVSLMTRIWNEGLNIVWHPKELLFDLIIKCTSVSHRVWDLLKPDSKCPNMLLHEALFELAAEGFVVRSALLDWYANFQQWSANRGTPEHNPQSILATIYYHGVSIYLSGIFDYRSQFNEMPTPTISQTIVQNHVDAILEKTEVALKTTNLAPVLFFFPLRVAGARVTTIRETELVRAMLREISTRGFVVADAFIADLKSLWRRKGI
ncbi:hypothetical protein BDV23DRAFT_170257 [Aspergillus alliaceus]|uniref:Fungal-specific transcription factor domain-containing protein n=1 Tax=Petromyces alliaceus TaxID=209559 RepID=A0A5N7CHF4_PETAA|nr:hypothetical protein BDV23DRAFT_170257 [Aspergillus alliaceus]